MKKPYKSVQIFENPYLERLTHVHPIVPLLVWGPIVLFLFYLSYTSLVLSVAVISGISLLGFVIWTISEYLLHRFVFHFKAKGRFQEKLQFLIHGNHHDDPNDPTRLVMPPAGSLILAVILFSLFRGVFALLGAANLAVPFFAGFVIGYLCYDYIHYGIHHFTPKSRLGKLIKQHHMLHHFATPELRWGVSSPFWDYILGTAGDSKKSRPSKRSESFANASR